MRVAAWTVVAVLLPGAMAGCATPRFESFAEAVHSCRQMQPGPTLWKGRRPTTHPLVAECLDRHGWNPDGSRISAPREGAALYRAAGSASSGV